MQVDAHIHLSMFTPHSVEEMLASSSQKWVMAGYDKGDWLAQEKIKKAFPDRVVTCMGLHPWKVLELSHSAIEEQMLWLEAHFAIGAEACGETGIDFFKDSDRQKKDLQLEVFLRHLEINRKVQKPLVIHCVQAHDLVLQHLSQETFKGIVHGFSGSPDIARRYIDRGFKISVGRGIYHKGFKTLKEVVQQLPLEELVIESDAVPEDQESPQLILSRVAESIAQIKSVAVEDVLSATARSTREVFKIYG